jgi:RNA polymerase sigma-70 factor (ECF subfamily)
MNDLQRELVKMLPRLRRFAYALAGDPSKGDDLVQEACVRAVAHLDQLQHGARLDSWMFKIVRNIWLNQLRAGRIRGQAVDIEDVPEPAGVDGRDVLESRLTLSQVLSALAKLPPEQRELIALVCFEGLSYQDAAQILDIPLGTATSRLARGRRALYAMAVEGQTSLEGEHDEVA